MNSLIARSVDRYLIQIQKNAAKSEKDIVQLFGTNFKTDQHRQITFIYPNLRILNKVLLYFAGVIDLEPFMDKSIADYYSALKERTKSTLHQWNSLSQAEREKWTEQLISVSQDYVSPTNDQLTR